MSLSLDICLISILSLSRFHIYSNLALYIICNNNTLPLFLINIIQCRAKITILKIIISIIAHLFTSESQKYCTQLESIRVAFIIQTDVASWLNLRAEIVIFVQWSCFRNPDHDVITNCTSPLYIYLNNITLPKISHG